MRGKFQDQGGLFSYISPEQRVPGDHPLQCTRQLVRDVLKELCPSLGRLYASEDRPSVPPEQFLSALLLQVFYGIRLERQLMKQLATICCIGGSLSWHRMMRSGIPRRSPRTVNGCKTATYSRSS